MSGTLAVIGGGRMGEAIIGGLVSSGAYPAAAITVADPNPARRDHLTSAFGVRTEAEGGAAVRDADVVLLAVKPQVMDRVVEDLAEAIGDSLVVSIAAGITCARLESMLHSGSRVVRVMPNTPALVGAGMTVVSGGSEATDDDVDTVAGMFSALGDVAVLDEGMQDACAAISGCGPAYMALIIDALARAGVRDGLTRDVAQRLALQTMKGTAALIEQTGQHPESVIDAVSSPGGSTIAGITALEDAGVRAAFASAVRAAVVRSRELGH
jgi:pyrroline-5-carboxylate reductase